MILEPRIRALAYTEAGFSFDAASAVIGSDALTEVRDLHTRPRAHSKFTSGTAGSFTSDLFWLFRHMCESVHVVSALS